MLDPAQGLPTQRTDEPGAVHLIEVGGRGGVYQHSAAVARELRDAGFRVVLHTEKNAEIPDSDLAQCRCISRHLRLSRIPRRVATLAQLLFATPRHVISSSPDALHVQGATPFNLALMLGICLFGRKKSPIVYSPHNTFARESKLYALLAIRLACKVADRVIVYSEPDLAIVQSWSKTRCDHLPLTQWQAVTTPARRRKWRDRLQGSSGNVNVVSFLGYLRSDKRPDLFLHAAKRIDGVSIAMVGQDAGALASSQTLAHALALDVKFVDEYLSVDDFCAVIEASDVIVTPYARASQSGVLALARQLGVKTVAAAVGGLGELATVTVDSDVPDAYSAGIRQALAGAKNTSERNSDAYVQYFRELIQEIRR